jgi:hypothetical protein
MLLELEIKLDARVEHRKKHLQPLAYMVATGGFQLDHMDEKYIAEVTCETKKSPSEVQR